MTEMARIWPSADELRPYRGKWVAVVDARVIWSADSMTDVVGALRVWEVTADSIFRVPLDPREE